MCNGVRTFLWHDFWNLLGPFLPRFGDRIIYYSAIHKNAHVVEVIGGGRWNWPITNSADLIAIKIVVGTILLMTLERIRYHGHSPLPGFLLLPLPGIRLDQECRL